MIWSLLQAISAASLVAGEPDLEALRATVAELDRQQRLAAKACPSCRFQKAHEMAKLHKRRLELVPELSRGLTKAATGRSRGRREDKLQDPRKPRTTLFEVPVHKIPFKEPTNTGKAAQDLNEFGVVILRGPHDETRCLKALSDVFSLALDDNASDFVHSPRHRHHLRLPLELPSLAETFDTAILSVAELLTLQLSEHNSIIELAAFVVNPGAETQILHRDFIPASIDVARTYSVQFPLTKVSSETDGGLKALSRSHFESPMRTRIFDYISYGQLLDKKTKGIRPFGENVQHGSEVEHSFEVASAELWTEESLLELFHARLPQRGSVEGAMRGLSLLDAAGMEQTLEDLKALSSASVEGLSFPVLVTVKVRPDEDDPKLLMEDWERLSSEDWSDMDSVAPVVPEVDCGDVVIYENSLLHGSTANAGKRTRATLYASFLGPGLLPDTNFAIDEALWQRAEPLSVARLAKLMVPEHPQLEL